MPWKFGLEMYPGQLESVERGSDTLNNQLEDLRHLRNTVAHAEPGSNVDPTKDEEPDYIVFVDYKGGKRTSTTFTLAEAQAKENAWKELFHRLADAAHQIRRHRARK